MIQCSPYITNFKTYIVKRSLTRGLGFNPEWIKALEIGSVVICKDMYSPNLQKQRFLYVHTTLHHTTLHHNTLHHTSPCHTIPRHATPCHTMPRHATLCHTMPRHIKPLSRLTLTPVSVLRLLTYSYCSTLKVKLKPNPEPAR